MAREGQRAVVVTVDPDLQDIVPAYVENRRQDVEKARTLLQKGEYAALRDLAHNMRGSGAGYGFERITELGGALEQAAKEEDVLLMDALTENLAEYLDKLSIVYG